jgi:hypothetical protein
MVEDGRNKTDATFARGGWSTVGKRGKGGGRGREGAKITVKDG